MVSQRPTPVTSFTINSVEAHCAAGPNTGGGLRIKIRLSGAEGEAMSTRSSGPVFTNTTYTSSNSTGSSTSTSASSPFSSSQVSDETTARRHAAIPPSLIVKEQFDSDLSFGALLRNETPTPVVKAPKLYVYIELISGMLDEISYM